MSDAETHKDMRNVETLCRNLVRGGADRKSLVIAIGGGVTGDVAGFAAASYLRGVALVHVPTTLVSQVDSSIGGKTGVNLPDGKNLVGAFYPPRLILTDPAVLRSLPDREFRGGLAEVIKHAIIADAKMFGYIERNIAKILKRDAAALEYLIPRNAAIKAWVVSKDEKESGLREILNFGHTFAHALESTTKYQRFQHGEAVAWGMMAAALLAHETKVCGAEYVSRIVALVRQIGPFPAWPNIQAEYVDRCDAVGQEDTARQVALCFVAATWQSRNVRRCAAGSGAQGFAICAAVCNEARTACNGGTKWLKRWRRRRFHQQFHQRARALRALPRRPMPGLRCAICFRRSRRGTTC